MAFKDILFPEEVEFDFTGGPDFFTAINSTAGGFEQRNQNWEQARHRFTVNHSLKDQAELDALKAFFMVLRGPAFSFRFKDWGDYFNSSRLTGVCTQVSDGAVVADGVETTFQIEKQYNFTTGATTESFSRPITLPVDQAVRAAEGVEPAEAVYLDAAAQSSGFTIARTGVLGVGGVITFSVAPTIGTVVGWEGTFDLPARFGSDLFQTAIQHFQIGSVFGVQIIEVRPEEDA